MSSEFDDGLDPAPPTHNAGLWAMSLADLLSILLTFFVMLYAYSYVNAQKSESTVRGVKGSFSQDRKSDDAPGFEKSTTGNEPLRQYYAEAKNFAQEALEIDEVRVREDGQKLIFRLPVSMLFDTGTTNVDDRKMFLTRMADGLSHHPIGAQLDVEFLIGREQALASGIGASVIPPSGTLPLSVLRAGAFARKMVALGVPEERVFVGVSEGDPAFFVLTFYPRDETRSGLEF